MQKVRWDIVGLAEVRRKGNELIQRKNGNYLYYSGETKGYKGVGFYINARIWKKIKEIKQVNERICVLKLEIERKILATIIQVYAPILDAEAKEKREFYEVLQETVERERENYTIVMGDWNGIVGKSEETSNIGRHGLGKRNENGERMIEFAQRNNLKIAGTFWRKRAARKWTWISPNGNTKNEIDHMLINDMTIVKNVEVLSKFEFSSDHRAGRCHLQIPKRIKYRKGRKRVETKKVIIPVHKLEEAEKFLEEKLSVLEEREQEMEVQEIYDIVERSIKETETKYGKEKERESTDDKITKRTKNLIMEREQLRKVKNPTPRQKIELTELQKLVKKEIKKDCREYETKIVKEIIEESSSTRRMKRELAKGTKLMTEIKNKEGKVITGREQMIKVITEFFRELYDDAGEVEGNTPGGTDEKEVSTSKNETIPPVPLITKSEVQKAIKSMKVDKSPGPDNINNSFLKTFQEKLTIPLVKILNKLMYTEKIPKQWSVAELRILHKKGEKSEIENYRPLSLTSNIGKVAMKVLKERISKQLDENQSPEQAGFRSGFSTTEHILTMNQIIEKAREYKIEIHCIFVDFRKAFDSIKHDKIWEALKNQGVEPKYIKLIKEIYKDAKTYVRTDRKGETFPIKKGVRQGDPLSSNLFNAVLEEVFRNLEWEGRGLKIDGKWLNNLRFADDIVLISENKDEVQKMLEELTKACRRVGLVINASKTKYMSNTDRGDVYANNNKIEKVNEYTYLGQILSFEDRTNKEIATRKRKAWAGFWALKQIFKSEMSTTSKIKILESNIIPILTYGAQTWSLTKQQTEGIKKTQRAMERSILKIKVKDRVRNEKIREETDAIDVGYRIRKLKYKYAGHVMRMGQERWVKRVIEWRPFDRKRGRGRPATRWRDEIVKSLGTEWGRLTHNREEWRQIGEAYARL